MLICWILGHRFDYEFSAPGLLWLICTRCGQPRILRETVEKKCT